MDYVSKNVFDGKRPISADRAAAYPKIHRDGADRWYRFAVYLVYPFIFVAMWAKRHVA